MTVTNWRDVPGYPNYQVSDGGEVRSCAYGSWRPLRATKYGKGYVAVSLWRNGECTKEYVHRLVLFVFVGPAPPGCEACHANGVRADNRLCNLRWDTDKANMADARRHGTARTTGERHPQSRLNVAAVLDIRSATLTNTEYVKKYGVTLRTVQAARSRQTWKSVWP